MAKFLKSITSGGWYGDESHLEKSSPSEGENSVEREQRLWEEATERASPSEWPPIETLEELHHHAYRILSNTGDPHRLERTKRMLERYTGEDWRLWKQRFSSSAAADTYGRSAVWGHTGCFQLLTLTWTPGCSSPVHNHPCERCFLLPLQGCMAERRYYVCEETKEVKEFKYTRLRRRRAYWMDDSIGWHAVSNEGDECAVSLHLYIPDIRKCKIVNPRTNDICWCVCPSETRDSLPAASVRLLEIVATAVRSSQSSGSSQVSLSTFPCTPDCGLGSPSLGSAGPVDTGLRCGSPVSPAGSSPKATAAEKHALENRTLSPWSDGQQRLLKLLLQAFQSDAEAELQQALAGGGSSIATNVSLFSSLLQPFSYYSSCAAALPPAACAAVMMHDLMFERNAAPLADGAALQQISLVLLLALMLSNRQPQEYALPFTESTTGVLPIPRATRSSTSCAAAKPPLSRPSAALTNVSSGAGAAAASAGASGDSSRRAHNRRDSDNHVGGVADAEGSQREILQRKVSAAETGTNANAARRRGAAVGAGRRRNVPSHSRSSSESPRCSSTDNSVLRVQLLEAAMRTVDAYANCKSSRLWNGSQEAPQLASVGRMLAAQLLLCECDDSYGNPVASTKEVSSQNLHGPCGHRFPVSSCAPCCCCPSGCCSGCVAASASPVALVLRFIDEAMLFHLASFLGWERRLQNATPPAVSGQLCASSPAKGGAAAAEATHGATTAGHYGRSPKGEEQEGALIAVAEQFLFPHSSSFSANRSTRPTEAGLNQSNTGTIGGSTNHRIHTPSVFYRNSTCCSRGKAVLLDLLRARVAEGGRPAADKDPAVQQAAANMVQSLLEDVSRFSPLREVVCASLLRLDNCRQTAAGELSRRLTSGETRWGKYETHQDNKTASCQLAAGHSLQKKLRQILGDFQRRQRSASGDRFDVGSMRRSSDKLYSRTSSHEKDSAAKTRTGRRTGSVLSGWMGAVKQRLGVTGTYATQSAPVSSSGDCVPPVSKHMPYGPHRTVRPLTHDSSAAQREREPPTAGGNERVVETQQEERLKLPEQQQKSAPLPEDAGDAAAPALTTSVAKRGCYFKQGVGCCEGAVTARKAEKDAFAACWLPAKEEHLALFRVLVAALHAFFSQETHHPQDLGSRRRLQEPVDMQCQAKIPVKQEQQLQTERKRDTEERRAVRRSQETHLQRGSVAKGVLEGHRQEAGRITEQAHDDTEKKKLECVPNEGNAANNTVEAAGLTEAAQEDLLCVYHFVAKHLEITPYTFSVYCCEEDVAQLAALRRAVQLFEGDGCPYVSKKLKIEVVRATIDGLLDVQDLSERVSSWQHTIGKNRIALEAARSGTTPGSLSKVNFAADEIGCGGRGGPDKRSSDNADGTPPLGTAKIVGWPLLVCCSAGRAGGVRCGFDSFADLRRLCSQHDVWLHVDASTGAAFLLPQEQPFQKYFNGINEADSILWGFCPPLLGQPLPSGASARSRQKASLACAALLYPRCGSHAALTELIESVWEDAFPIALLSRNPAAFFFSSSFRCSCSRVCSPVQADRSAEPPEPKIRAAVLCDAVSQAGITTDGAEIQNATRLQKGEGGGVLSDLSTACVTSPQLDSCASPPTTSSGGYCLGELHATNGFGLDSEDVRASTFSSGGNDTSSSFSRLQECDRLHLADSHTEGEEHDESNGPWVDQNGRRNFASRGTRGKGQHLPGVAGVREVTDLQCKDRGMVLAHWCGARRKLVGLGFSVWCFWKKLGDVGVANRARQVYLHCRRLEVFAANFPLRLKSAEYPKFVRKKHGDTETLENATEDRRFLRGSSHVSRSSSSNEDDSSDDVAGDYDIDKKVIFDYEYARLHEASVLPLVAEAAMLLGLPESVVTESPAALRYASAGGEVQGCQDERDVGEKMCRACTAGDRRAICPFRMCASSNEEGRTRMLTSPSTIAFRWSLPGYWLPPEAAVATGKQPTMQYIDEVTRKDLEGRLAMYLKSILDTLKKREEDMVARRGLSSEAGGERSSYTHSAEESTAYSPVRAAGHPEHVATHKESEMTSRSEGRRAADHSEASEGSDAVDFSSESPPASDDEAGATSATEVPSFTLLTENFLVDVGSAPRYESAVPAQGSSSVDQKAAPDGTVRSPFLTISLKDPRMTEDEAYSLLCLIDRLGELLWSSARACTDNREVSFDTLSPDYAEHLHRDLGGSPLTPRYVP